jgi:hypothetical protein
VLSVIVDVATRFQAAPFGLVIAQLRCAPTREQAHCRVAGFAGTRGELYGANDLDVLSYNMP